MAPDSTRGQGTAAGWSAPNNGKVFNYRNRDSHGIGNAGIQAGAPGKPALSKVQVKGKGKFKARRR